MTEPKPRPSGTLSPADVAARWGVSVEVVRGLIHRGELQGFRLGPRLIRVAAEALADYEQRRTVARERERSTATPNLSETKRLVAAAIRSNWRRKPKCP